ncbi:Octicosapeptide/Phox/Bem1p family protein [Perilla frutescens var. hirtella]|nr:Octicosapeptide/Phox/Bem1p family protein [Perilla frutescens var. hirtella]KAH6815782.1 Octicosapeptide/Phox/Bem1p family protein [Perilla frutescens var. frutescens]
MIQKVNSSGTIKFLYSYGGKILPRPTDGKLRYAGGCTRVLAVDRSVSYAELLVKFGESCGSSMILKCKLPTEDLDVLVSIKSDEELRLLFEEYERVSPESKIRAVLFPIKSVKKVSQPSSPVSCFDFPSLSKPHVAAAFAPRYRKTPPFVAAHRSASQVVGYPVTTAKKYCFDSRSSRHLYNAAHRIHTH